MRYSHGPDDDAHRPSSGTNVRGSIVENQSVRRTAPKRLRSTTTKGVVIAVIIGQLVSVAVILVAQTAHIGGDGRLALNVAAIVNSSALLVWLVVHLLRRDARSAHRRTHCPNCNYDTRGLPEPKCPECGLILLGHEKA
jgi:hypothetical protein